MYGNFINHSHHACRLLFPTFVAGSAPGADVIANGSRWKAYQPKGVINVVSFVDWGGICIISIPFCEPLGSYYLCFDGRQYMSPSHYALVKLDQIHTNYNYHSFGFVMRLITPRFSILCNSLTGSIWVTWMYSRCTTVYSLPLVCQVHWTTWEIFALWCCSHFPLAQGCLDSQLLIIPEGMHGSCFTM